MLPNARKKQILAWLKLEKSLLISDISKRLNVSEMTIYRDIKPLIESNEALKIPNGIGLPYPYGLRDDQCISCLKTIHTRLRFQIRYENGKIENLCCANCGLFRFKETNEKVTKIACNDYLTDHSIEAQKATYLLYTELELNCCQPQAITFESRIHARQFQSGFGGDVYNFEEAMRVIAIEMNGNYCC